MGTLLKRVEWLHPIRCSGVPFKFSTLKGVSCYLEKGCKLSVKSVS